MNSRIQDIFKRRIVQHVIFWIALLLYSALYFGYPDRVITMLKLFLANLPIDMAFVYITIYYLLPKFLLKKKYIMFSLLFLIAGYFDEVLFNLIIALFFHPDRSYTWQRLFIDPSAFNFFPNYFYGLIAVAIRLIKIWYNENEKSKKTMQEKFNAELKLKEIEHSMLKAQLHPHFLFNTLNNLYAMTLEKSDKSPEVVLKMSAMLNYMLYECNAGSVLLNKEIEQVLNYISLEQLRYDDALTVSIENDCQSTSISIAPLLILPFIENCFKHGTSNEVGSSWINIIFKCKDEQFYMSIENSVYEQAENSDEIALKGIGLSNVKQRLESLYPDKFDLQINESEFKYSVILKLNLCL